MIVFWDIRKLVAENIGKYILKLLAKTYRDLREDQYDNNKDREKRDNLCHH